MGRGIVLNPLWRNWTEMHFTNGARDPSNRLVTFVLADQRYALRLSVVQRVVAMVRITPLPQAPAIVLGAINVQGVIVPVINMRRRFGLPERPPGPQDQLLVAYTARRPVALVADDVSGVLEYRDQDLVSARSALPGVKYVESVVKLRDGLVLIHDLDRFLSLDEEQTLERALA